MSQDHNRRETDKLAALDIDQMILAEDDPKQRAFLIVLNSINRSLIANTATISEVSEKLETHLINFEKRTEADDARLNKGRGAWKVLAAVIGVVQVLGLAIWNEARTEIKDIHAALQKEEVALTQMKAVQTATQNIVSQLEARVLFVEKVNSNGEKK